MNIDDFSRFEDEASSSGVLFYFRGEFTPAVVETVSAQVRQRLEDGGVRAPVRRKLFSTFVEMAQNILHYGVPAQEVESPDDGQPHEGKSGSIALGVDGEDHWIACGNAVRVEHIARITERLHALRAMSLDEIKASYRRQLHDLEHEHNDAISRGAGLGLLTIARDARQPLEWSFVSSPRHEGRHAYFFIKAVI